MSNYKKISENIEELTISNPDTPYRLRWINIENAGKKEISYLKKNFGFDIKHLQAAAADSFAQRPMIYEEDHYLFLILHFPVFVGEKIAAGEIEFFIGHGYLVTVHNGNSLSLKKFFQECREEKSDLLSYSNESSSLLLYETLSRLIKGCYPLIDENSQKIDEVEDLIFANQQKIAVSEILRLKRNVINLRKILQNHKNILRKLSEMESSIVPREIIKKHYIGLVEHSKRIWEMLDIQKETIEALNDTNESLLNSQMTGVMKTLTIFSVIIFPLTLFAAIFSMRAAGMPLIDHPWGFWLIVGIMFVCTIFMLAVFKRKKWL